MKLTTTLTYKILFFLKPFLLVDHSNSVAQHQRLIQNYFVMLEGADLTRFNL